MPAGYGFAAIIVAFVGRLHPVGMVFAAVLMSMFYIGGELAQSRLGLPKPLTGVFQGLLLFTLLACDTLMQHRVRLAPGVDVRRPRADERVRLLVAATLNAGTVLALAALGLLVNEKRRRRQPRRRGHDAGRRDRRLRRGGPHRQRLARLRRRRRRRGALLARSSACW